CAFTAGSTEDVEAGLLVLNDGVNLSERIGGARAGNHGEACSVGRNYGRGDARGEGGQDLEIFKRCGERDGSELLDLFFTERAVERQTITGKTERRETFGHDQLVRVCSIGRDEPVLFACRA